MNKSFIIIETWLTRTTSNMHGKHLDDMQRPLPSRKVREDSRSLTMDSSVGKINDWDSCPFRLLQDGSTVAPEPSASIENPISVSDKLIKILSVA